MKKVINGIVVACVAVGFSMVVGCTCPASGTKPAAPAPKAAAPKAEVKAPAVPAPAAPAAPAPAPAAPASK